MDSRLIAQNHNSPPHKITEAIAGRATSIANADALGRPLCSVLALGGTSRWLAPRLNGDAVRTLNQ